MEQRFIINGIIDVIKELREIAKCPFCERKLQFKRAQGSTSFSGEKFTLRCKHCKLEFTVKKEKEKDRWTLEEVRERGFF